MLFTASSVPTLRMVIVSSAMSIQIVGCVLDFYELALGGIPGGHRVVGDLPQRPDGVVIEKE